MHIRKRVLYSPLFLCMSCRERENYDGPTKRQTDISFHSEFTLSIINEHYLFIHKSRQGPQLVGPVHVWKCLVWKHIEWAVTWPELRRQQYQPWITWRHTNMCPWKDLRNSSRQIKLRHLLSFLFVYMSSFSTLTNWMTDSPTHILTLLSGCNIINSIELF